MIKKDYLAIEPQFLCDVCSEAITNPICPSCLTIEIQAWMTMYPSLNKELFPILNEYLEKIEDKSTDSAECIKCNSNKVAVCPCCFTNYVLEQLRKIHANELVLKEFLEFFNYDFEHNVYTDDAEELGVI